jgi:hypothetical protein
MPRRSPRPATAEGSIEHVLCHEKDCMPRILCFFPLAIGTVFGAVFSSNALQGEPWVKITFSALGFLAVAAALSYCAAGLPIFRRHGCASGCWELLAAAAAALHSLQSCLAPGKQSRGHASEPEFVVTAAPGLSEAAAVQEHQVAVSAAGGQGSPGSAEGAPASAAAEAAPAQ